MSVTTRLTLPMPRLGETMEEGTITEWLVQPGQAFGRGDPLLEIETDKTMVEYPALGGGILVEALVSPGEVVEVGRPIAVIETADNWAGIDSVPAPRPAEPAAAGPGPAAPDPAQAEPRDAPQRTDRPRATPLARRLARQNGIALEQVTGTGRRGRIEAADIRALVSSGSGSGAPVVLRIPAQSAPVHCVHGLAGLGSNWAALRTRLQRMGLDTAAPDLPGHGRNPIEAAGVDTLIDWLAQELSALDRPVHLTGHSLGAHVAVCAALRAPARVARLTLLAPAGCGIEINGAFLSGMAAGPGIGELSHLTRLLGPKAAQLDGQALAAMSRDLHGRRLTALAASVARGDVQLIDSIGPLRQLAGTVPVRAIFGLADRIVPREHAFNMPPHVACHMVEAGHMPHWDATEAVAAIIAAA